MVHDRKTPPGMITDLAAQVQRNCRISDARSWGYHSICGLLLRLRELFKWEQGCEPWTLVPKEDILPWIEEREAEWSRLEEAELDNLDIEGRSVDPYDAEAVNASISKDGYHYAAGHGMAGKPLFVLAEVLDRRCVDNVNVILLGPELVRDLSPVPAMNRDGVVIARREAMKWFLWFHLEEAGTKGEDGVAARALATEGVVLADLLKDTEGHRDWYETLVDSETENAVYHELGEIAEDNRMGGRWRHAFGLSCGMKAELLARGLKDVLADTGPGGRLEHIIREESILSLGLFCAFSEGLRKRLFPGLGEAFDGLLADGDWHRINELRRRRYDELRTYVDPGLALFEGKLTAEEVATCADALEERMMG